MGLTAHDLQSIDSVQAEGIDVITGDNAFERFQNRFLKAYVGTIWGHELHITELLSLPFFLAAVVLTYLMSKGAFMLAPLLMSSGLVYTSGLSLTVLWGLVKVYSLAEIADKLEATANRSVLESEQYKALNGVLAKQNDIYGQRLKALSKEVGMVDQDAKKMESLLHELEVMQLTLKRMNEEQIKLGDLNDAYAEEKRQAVEDSEYELKKDEFKLAFKYITAESNGVANTPQQFQMIRSKMETLGIPWTRKCIAACADGVIHKFEMLDMIDEALSTRIYRMKECRRIVSDLETELERKGNEKSHLEAVLRGEQVVEVIVEGQEDGNGTKKRRRKKAHTNRTPLLQDQLSSSS